MRKIGITLAALSFAAAAVLGAAQGPLDAGKKGGHAVIACHFGTC